MWVLNEEGYQRRVHGAPVLAEKEQMEMRKVNECPVLTYVGHPLVACCSDVEEPSEVVDRAASGRH